MKGIRFFQTIQVEADHHLRAADSDRDAADRGLFHEHGGNLVHEQLHENR